MALTIGLSGMYFFMDFGFPIDPLGFRGCEEGAAFEC